MKLFVFKSGSKLVAATSEDKDKIGKMPVGEPFQITYTRIRNPRLHGLYFAFLSKVYDNIPETLEYTKHPKSGLMVKRWPKPINFRKQMEIYAGHYDESITMKGEIRLEPKSIAYGKLDDTEFSELYTSVKNVIGRIILPKMDMEVVEREIEQFY